MAGRKKKTSSGSDSAEAVKPLIVLVLLGTILYGGYSVIRKGRDGAAGNEAADVVESLANELDIDAVEGASPSADTVVAAPQAALPLDAAAALPPQPLSVSQPTAEPAATGRPTYVAGREGPPPTEGLADLAAAGSLAAADFADDPAATMADVPPPASFPGVEAATMPAPTAGMALPPAQSRSKLVAFTSDWDEAHEQLSAGRYAEALALLSAWYDDADLAPEESQRLEDLLGQLAGTVIYSQEDLLMPPHIVGAGETLPAIAAPLGVNWQLLAKINGIPHPEELIPGEPLKLIHGPFDAEVSLSRRRVTLRLTGNYAGSFPMVVGEAVAARAGESLAVLAVNRSGQQQTTAAIQQASFEVPQAPSSPGAPVIRLQGDLLLVAAEDPAAMAHEPPATHLVVSRAHLADLIDILTPASRVVIGR